MSFTDQKPFIFTEDHAKTRYGFIREPLACRLCGHAFVLGDTVRWVYCNGTQGAQCGNFFTCASCDGEDVIERGIASFQNARKLAKQWGVYGPDWQRYLQ